MLEDDTLFRKFVFRWDLMERKHRQVSRMLWSQGHGGHRWKRISRNLWQRAQIARGINDPKKGRDVNSFGASEALGG